MSALTAVSHTAPSATHQALVAACIVTVANMAPSYKRLSARTRSHLVNIVSSFLNEDDLKKASKGAFEKENFLSDTGKKQYRQSPISSAVALICNDAELLEQLEFPSQQPVSEKVTVSVKNACAYWFWQVAKCKRQSFQDKPRRTKADWNLHYNDFQILGHLLTTVEWLDSQRNWRRYGSLEHMLQDGLHILETGVGVSSEKLVELQLHVDELRRIKEKATGRAHDNLDILLPRVCAKCRCSTEPRRRTCSHPLVAHVAILWRNMHVLSWGTCGHPLGHMYSVHACWW